MESWRNQKGQIHYAAMYERHGIQIDEVICIYFEKVHLFLSLSLSLS